MSILSLFLYSLCRLNLLRVASLSVINIILYQQLMSSLTNAMAMTMKLLKAHIKDAFTMTYPSVIWMNVLYVSHATCGAFSSTAPVYFLTCILLRLFLVLDT